ncbi:MULTISPECIES: amino acid permease [unclassified Novosphingobium]|uniref:amino acid permease n=1 Tax=unclassified Novosphingobium TaxID=2644732 RepID=UPI00086C0FD7|nr:MULTISPECIES: amino acid permease [unclassified Novosphingobium]MBN9143887.1 amino acid permease [Novosphingobium sp.]MDR6707072.1 APA family basic amino acid/polyamine antiporter [Novosphingobium sp. 1748]NKJ02170.1 APA family basic amino acid/polyamine antiporter [Novosphingobium sp. SG707]ODU84469.1 MAG: amino acid permease [Novosphingobium sp. SCN 63-17]OJX93008.1 MAG: amino acid permease [Novosphingobium sp. 63-713]
MFGRVKPLDAILATAEKKSLHRSLGAFQLTMLGVGAVIGTGIFVLTAEAAQKAGPGMMLSFIIAGFVCAVAALCYAEMSSMVPVSGSAYTYSYAVMGELVAWMVGWALILEYAIAAGAVSVGWSGYMIGFVQNTFHITVPLELVRGPFDGGIINLPAMLIAAIITGLLVLGTKESATVNAALVAIKIVALSMFIALTLPVIKSGNFKPFAPLGFTGISGAAASIFFAYVGFDAVSTAAEETKNPQRNMPIGLIGSLAICTIFYMLVAAGVIGTVGAQPVFGAHGEVLSPGTAALSDACKALNENAVVCSKEALAWTLRQVGHPFVGWLVGAAAILALPSVILMMMFGQTRIFFVMSRDGLLPEFFSKVHPKFHTPHVITVLTGVFVALFAAFFPVGLLADVSNSGTLFAFGAVSVAVMVLRRTDPNRHRPFRTPGVNIVAPISIAGCIYLFISLSKATISLFLGWGVVGLFVYYFYSRSRSHVGRGLVEVHEDDSDAPDLPVPPMPGA